MQQTPDADPLTGGLDALMATASTAVVRRVGGDVVHIASATEALASLRHALHVRGLADGSCMCWGDYAIEFRTADDRRLTTVHYHHAANLRWSGWPDDAVLSDGPALLHWLARQGCHGPLDEFLHGDARRAAAQQAELDWRAAAPLAPNEVNRLVLTAHTGRSPDDAELAALALRLAAVHPDPVRRALALLRWHAAGTGRHSGHPVYEAIPAALLRDLPITAIVSALESPDADERHAAGAVRHLTGFEARKDLPRDISGLSSGLRALLLATARAAADPTIHRRAEQLLKPEPERTVDAVRAAVDSGDRGAPDPPGDPGGGGLNVVGADRPPM